MAARRRAARVLPERLLAHPLAQGALGYRRRGSLVLERIADLRLAYDIRSQVGLSLFTAGDFEATEVAVGEAMLRRRQGAIALDVGSNLGFHALSWMGAAERIYAWEPSRRARALLASNLRRNHAGSRVEIVPLAASDGDGEVEFVEHSDLAYSGLHASGRSPVMARYTVTRTSIDAFAAARGLRRIDLLKIDVEGHENEALRGAERVLRELRPHLLVEIFGGDAPGRDPDATVRWVVDRGYDAQVIARREIRPYVAHDDRFFNYIFTPR